MIFEFGCHNMECAHYRRAELDNEVIEACKIYNVEGMKLRMRIGYCPIIDKYFNPVVQEVYDRSQKPGIKGRVGQQKQRRKK